MTQPLIQNFSVPAGADTSITFTITSDVTGDSLVGTTVHWQVFAQVYGMVDPASDPILTKSTTAGSITTSGLTCTVALDSADTVSLLRNYYHELLVVDTLGNKVPVTVGIMTVTSTEIRV